MASVCRVWEIRIEKYYDKDVHDAKTPITKVQTYIIGQTGPRFLIVSSTSSASWLGQALLFNYAEDLGFAAF